MRNSNSRTLLLVGILLYVISPLDILPDILPILGWVDDGLLASIAINEIVQMVVEHQRYSPTPTPDVAVTHPSEAVIDVEAIPVS